jgi:hypothetical protein
MMMMITVLGFQGWGLPSSFTTARHPLALDDEASPPRAGPHLSFQLSTLDQGPPPVRIAILAADWLFGGWRSRQLRVFLALSPPMPSKGSKGSQKSPRGRGNGAKGGKGGNRAALPPAADSGASGGYIVPGDEVPDEDLEFDFLNWLSCQRSRGLEPALSVRTRILLACHACDHLDKSVLIESWNRSGLMPFDPERVLSTLTDDADDLGDRRRSGRVKSKDAAAAICKLAEEYAEGIINDQELLIKVKELADAAVCYEIMQSTGAVAAKGVKTGAIDQHWETKKRKISKTDKHRTGSFQGDDYDAVATSLAEEEEALNQSKPWECKVQEKKKGKKQGKVCGHRLKSTAGLTKHANHAHHGIGKYFNHVTGVTSEFVGGDAAAAAASPNNVPPPAAAAAGGEGKRLKCQLCQGTYTAATIGKHNNSPKHTAAVEAASAEAASAASPSRGASARRAAAAATVAASDAE